MQTLSTSFTQTLANSNYALPEPGPSVWMQLLPSAIFAIGITAVALIVKFSRDKKPEQPNGHDQGPFRIWNYRPANLKGKIK